MIDRHKRRPRAVRMPDGLEAWFEQYASKVGQPVNAVLVTALETFRQQIEGGTTTAPKAADPNCQHPKASVIKGRCTRCQTFVGY